MKSAAGKERTIEKNPNKYKETRFSVGEKRRRKVIEPSCETASTVRFTLRKPLAN